MLLQKYFRYYSLGYIAGEGALVQIILNYKSYYEAFKIGIIDNGFTSVARVLFYPIFKDHTVCDENGTPYEADNTYSSRWGNGQIPIQIEIQQAASDNAMLREMIDYFENKVVPYEISDALKDEMYDAMVELVQQCDLRECKKTQLLKYYHDGKLGEFLARVFQRALLGNNKVAPTRKKKTASDEKSESLEEFNGLILNKRKKPETKVPEEIQDEELGYVLQLYAAYSEAYQVPVNSLEELDIVECREHLERQRKNYYLAETIHRKVRDSICDDEENGFAILKDEVETGIYEISRKKYLNGLEKADVVLDRAGMLPISVNTQNVMFNWIGAGEKKGICHMLVNEEKIEWVKKDAE